MHYVSGTYPILSSEPATPLKLVFAHAERQPHLVSPTCHILTWIVYRQGFAMQDWP